jgi:ankyrin repeat protein
MPIRKTAKKNINKMSKIKRRNFNRKKTIKKTHRLNRKRSIKKKKYKFKGGGNVQDNEDLNPAQVDFINAIKKKNITKVTTYLNNNDDINFKNEAGDFPLIIATKLNHIEIINLLLDKADLNVVDKEQRSSLQYACANASLKAVQALVNKKADINYQHKNDLTPLMFIMLSGKLLTNTGEQYRNKEQEQEQEKKRKEKKRKENERKIVQLLLNKGADITKLSNTKSDNGYTVLHIGCSSGPNIDYSNNVDSINLLLNHIDINTILNLKTTLGYTPLNLACMNNYKDIVEALLKKNPNITISDNNKNTPLHHACENNSVDSIKLLLNHKDINNILNLQNDEGDTPLNLAIKNNSQASIEALLEKEPNIIKKEHNITVSDNNKNTLLHYACKQNDADENNYLEIVKDLLSVEKINDILNLQNSKGNTPLHYACKYHQLEILKILLKKKEINVNIEGEDGKYPLHYIVEMWNFPKDHHPNYHLKFKLLIECIDKSNKSNAAIINKQPTIDRSWTPISILNDNKAYITYKEIINSSDEQINKTEIIKYDPSDYQNGNGHQKAFLKTIIEKDKDFPQSANKKEIIEYILSLETEPYKYPLLEILPFINNIKLIK